MKTLSLRLRYRCETLKRYCTLQCVQKNCFMVQSVCLVIPVEGLLCSLDTRVHLRTSFFCQLYVLCAEEEKKS